jgi:hypothetical protein
MSTVVRQVVAEVKAKGEQFEAEMKKIEARAKSSKGAIEGTGAGADAVGRKFEMAGRQIASATETIARTGKVSGEAGKTMLAAAGQIAFGFGPGGIAIGALSIFGLAVATAMGRARAETKATREEFEKTLRVMSEGRDYEGTARTWMRTAMGDPTSDDRFEQMGFLPLQERIRQFREARQRALPGGGFQIMTTPAERLELAAMVEALEKLRVKYDAVTAAMNEQAAAKVRRDAEVARLKAEEDASDAAKKGAEKAREQGERAAEAFAEGFARVQLQILGSAGDRAGAQIQQLIEEGLRIGAPAEQIAALERMKAQAMLAADGVAALKAAWEDYESGTGVGSGPWGAVVAGAGQLVKLSAAIDDARSKLLFLEEGTDGYRAVQAELNTLLEKFRKLTGQDDGKDPKLVDATRETALQLQQAADGALQLAQNLFGAEAGAIGTLRAVTQIAGNLPTLAKAFGDGGSTLGKVSGVLGILGAVTSLFSDRAERQAENTKALRDLTARLTLLGSGLGGSGADLATGRAGTGRILDEMRRRGPGSWQAIAHEFGISIDELKRIAADYGIELDGGVKSLIALQKALDDAALKLAEFGTDLDSQRSWAAAYAQAFGITDPSALLGLTQQTYGGRSPALDSALQGLDLSTAEGRAAARKNLQDLLMLMQAGGDIVTGGMLGTLGGDEFLQAILDLIASLNDVDESQGINTSTVGSGDRVITASDTQITADQASRLLGVQTSALAELRLIREAVVASRTPMPVPVLTAGFSSPGTGGGLVINIAQEFYGATSPREVARATSDAVVEAIDRGLGRRLVVERRYQGRAVTS